MAYIDAHLYRHPGGLPGCQSGGSLLDDSIALLDVFIPHMQVVDYWKSLWG